MIKRSFFLLATTAFLSLETDVVIASDSFTTHTQITPIELKPASLLDLRNSFQTAAICFLGMGSCTEDMGYKKDNNDLSIDTGNQCLQEGYLKLNCNSAQQIDGGCPYNSAYGKSCICLSNLVACPAGQAGTGDSCGGKYLSCQCSSSLVSCASNQVGSGASCGGKYQSCTCKPEYQYNSSNCTSPRSVSGSSCGGKYTGCSCPAGVSVGAYGCKEHYPSPCGSVCKIAYSDNCHNRTAVSIPYGCMSYFADCPSKCERAYSDNCRNRTAVTATYGCQQAWGDCQSKCQTAYADNCRNRTAVSTPYGCQTYFSDCTSKCQTAYADNCRNRTAVSTPYGCQTYFSDCTSKCQTAYADNCRNRTAVNAPNGCQTYWSDCSSKCQTAASPVAVGDILFSDMTTSPTLVSGKTPIGVVFDISSGRKAIALEYSSTAWGPNGDIPKLTNCTKEHVLLVCNLDGKQNTQTILEYGSATMGYYAAAEYCNNYVTAGTSRGDWFLPSLYELELLGKAYEKVDAVIKSLGKPGLATYRMNSSNEIDATRKWTYYTKSKQIDNDYVGKSSIIETQAIIQF